MSSNCEKETEFSTWYETTVDKIEDVTGMSLADGLVIYKKSLIMAVPESAVPEERRIEIEHQLFIVEAIADRFETEKNKLAEIWEQHIDIPLNKHFNKE